MTANETERPAVADRLATIQANRGTYFDWLGLTPAATQREIEEAYRELRAAVDAMAAPDSGPLSAALERAYATLADYGHRAAYEKRGYRTEEAAQEQVKDDPLEHARLLFRKAKTLHGQKEFAKAAQVVAEAIRLQPDRAEYHLLLGLCQLEEPEKRRLAEASLLKAIEMESWNAEPCAALGLLYQNSGLPRRAEVWYRKALALEPRHAVARRRLDEICGPEKSALQQAQERLRDLAQKVLPSLFKRRAR